MKKKLTVAVQTALQSEHAVAECWVGMDVAKAHLGVAIWPTPGAAADDLR